MALVRRVQSFNFRRKKDNESSNKSESTEKYSDMINPRRCPTRRATATLERRKSRSYDTIVNIEMQQNPLFRKQAERNNYALLEEVAENPQPLPRPVVPAKMEQKSKLRPTPKERQKKLERRRSVSLDDLLKIEQQKKGVFGNKRNNQAIRRIDIGELMTDFQVELEPTPKNEAKFPLTEEEQVELRTPTRSSNQQRLPRSKTFNFDSPNREQVEFELDIKGLSRIYTQTDCTKLSRNQIARYGQNGIHLMEMEFNRRKDLDRFWEVKLSRDNMTLKKKEIEVKNGFKLEFHSSKEAQKFYDQAVKLTNEKVPIKKMLKRFFGMRSSRDLLESKGILKNEPIFGNTLQNVYNVTNSIPEFIRKTVELIERPENIKSIGLYRTSGNLATIQKIRFEVDVGKLQVLDEYQDDVDVLTGCLKLFFRELKELLISQEVFQQLVEIVDTDQSLEKTKEVLNSLPIANREVLLFLLAHLVKVHEHKESNRMDIYNLAVCWGPSLIGISEPSTDLVSQATKVSKIMEHLITYQKTIIDSKKSPFGPAIKRNSKNQSPKVSEDRYCSEVVSKLTGLIEKQIDVKGIYKKSGSEEIKLEILKKISQKRLNELDTGKYGVHDLCSALKKYLLQLPEPLVPEMFQNLDCDNLNDVELQNYLDALPRKEPLILLLRHIGNVQRSNPLSELYIVANWTATLIQPADRSKIEKCSRLVAKLIKIANPMPDVIREPTARESTYDNLEKEASCLDDKTDEDTNTKL